MVKVLRALPGEKREIQLKPWLYRIARNESIETLRRRREGDELEPEQAAVVGVAETAAARERLRTLLADLEQLPERQRAALVMRELSGLEFAEIGAAFGSSAAVARQTLYEARLSLRQLEAGREMRCADVMRELSDADGRVTRRREIRAHLRGCADCRAFREEIARRHQDLAAIAPLPVAASAGLLHGALGGAAGSGGGVTSGAGVAGSVGAGTGKIVATSAIVKSAATVAVVAVVGVSAADRGGLIDLPLTGGGNGSTQSAQESRGAAGGDASSGSADSAGAASRQLPGGSAGSDGQTANGKGSSQAKSDASGDGSSNSQAGANPPGGGYGRSASERHGRPERLPAAAAHGQRTSGAHKPAHPASPPGQSASGGRKGKSSGGSHSAAKPPPASSNGKPQAASPPPPVEAPPQARGGSLEAEPGATPPEPEG
jgi:RNA polymerase sigma factor (sigma-70 family)